MFVYICKKITDRQIIQEVERGATTAGEISDRLGAGASTQCGKCKKCVRKLVRKQLSEMTYYPISSLLA
jgi:bacterioferritin-associated ferredoxin